MFNFRIIYLFFLMLSMASIPKSGRTDYKNVENPIKFHLIVLAPGHFHAALVQKFMYKGIDSIVQVFAPEGSGLKEYLGLINKYNQRTDNPTHWNEKIYKGPDYLQRMLKERPGKNTIVVIAGNNKMKTKYITKSIEAGMNVLADKPMVISPAGFTQLEKDFTIAKRNELMLYDIMTMRYEITDILQKELSESSGIFGKLEAGTLKDPAVIFENVHYFYKEVSGNPLIRPAWYFDVKQQGEGIADVTTHLIDLIEWECFPEEILDYKKDIKMFSVKHWATTLTLPQFKKVTGDNAFPDFLKDDIQNDVLSVYANGEMNYTIKGIHARVSAVWRYQAPAGSGDTYYSILRGTKADLIIRQGKEQNFKPILYIKPTVRVSEKEWTNSLKREVNHIQKKYPGISVEKDKEGWQVVIPDKYKISDEEQFSMVVHKYLQYLNKGKMPGWEISDMLAKYYTTTQALEMVNKKK